MKIVQIILIHINNLYEHEKKAKTAKKVSENSDGIHYKKFYKNSSFRHNSHLKLLIHI